MEGNDGENQQADGGGNEIDQVGGASLKELGKVVEGGKRKFKGLVTNVTLELEIPRSITTDPEGPELFADDIISLINKHAPIRRTHRNTRVGVNFESDEILESVGLAFKDISKLKTGDIVRNMETMAQSGKSPLDLEVPRITARITYITPVTGSSTKRKFGTGHILELKFGKAAKRSKKSSKKTKKKKKKACEFLDDEAEEDSDEDEEAEDEEEEEEEEEDEEVEQEVGKKKRGNTNIMRNNVTHNCLVSALYQAHMWNQYKKSKSKEDGKRYRQSISMNRGPRDNSQVVFKEIQRMKDEAGITKTQDFDYYDIQKFQETVFAGTHQILVFEENSTIPFFCGEFVGQDNVLVLYLAHGHFSGVRNVCSLLQTKYYCCLCLSRYRDAASHYNCKLLHRLCGKPNCPKPEEGQELSIECASCHLHFKTQLCYDNHLEKGSRGGKSRCEYTKFCKKCQSPYYTNKNAVPHQCGHKYCQRCQCLVEEYHFCSMSPCPKNESTLTRLRGYYDIESSSGKLGHQKPVLFRCVLCCPKCSKYIPKTVEAGLNEKCENCSPEGRLKIIECVTPENRGVDVKAEMNKWMFSQRNKGFVLVAHNASGYDGQFILEELIASNKSAPELCLEGSKLIYLKHKGVRLVDSLKYLTMSLSAVGKAFEVDSIKGDFPVLFIKEENFDYVGPIPDDKYYALDNKSSSVRKELVEHLTKAREEGQTFNFFEELQKYCYNDVYILATAMTIFEREFEAMTNVCLLEESVTAASAAMKVFRRNHLHPDRPIGLDAKPGAAMTHSIVSQKHLAWIGHKEGVQVDISTTYGEKKVGKYRVDGFIDKSEAYPEGQIIEFNGCYYHAHDCSYSDESIIGDSTAKEIRERDQKRIAELEKEYPVKVVWECEAKEELSKNLEMAEFCEGYEARGVLRMERALVGGRTEVFKLYENDELVMMMFLDVVSLYPAVMKHEGFPIGRPTEIPVSEIPCPIDKPGCIPFWGFLSCKIVAPDDLEIPLIGDKSTGKLVFALCKKCTKEQNQSDCNHTDDERAFTGVYTTVELEKALELGYKITEVYHGTYFKYWVGNDDKGEGGLFSSYVNQMIQEKIYSSGWPADVKTDEEKEAFCKGYMEKEHIDLNDHSRFVKNVGRRASSKLMVNSLWGKLAQGVDREHTKVIIDPAVFYKLYYDKSVVIVNVRPVNDVIVVKYRKQKETLQSLKTSAVHIAAYVTAYARLRLYKFMEKVGAKNLIYTDTDSLIYGVPRGCEDPLKDEVGPYLGQLTNELKGEMTEFVALGPKTYCFKDQLKDGQIRTVCKAKGIVLNSVADKMVTFDKMKTMVDEVLEEVEDRTVMQIPQFTMRRDRDHKVYGRNIKKSFKYTFDKRRVLPDGTTLPFGYRHK